MDHFNNVTVSPEPLNPSTGALKAVLIVGLFLLTLLASMLAFVLKNYAIHRHTSNRGVFLGTCLLDLLPDSLECVEKAFKYLQRDAPFPVAPFFIAVGFLFVLFIEQAIVYARERNWIGDSEVDRLLGEHHDPLPESPSVPEPPTPGNEDNDIHFDPEAHSSMRAILFVAALSMHAVFEGTYYINFL